MASYYNNSTQYRSYYISDCIGPGALGNDQIKMCKYCSQNGFHNEPIIFRKLNCKWVPFDYFSGQRHQHKYREVEDDK